MEWTYTVWDEAQLVYVALPKVANSAVKSVLLETYVKDKRWANPHGKHVPYVEATADQVQDDYQDYVSFAVVRNPFDRFVSFWTDKIVGAGWYKRLRNENFEIGSGFEETALTGGRTADETTDPHLRSQRHKLLDASGDLIPDLLLRFDHIDEDWEMLRRIVAQRSKKPLKPLAPRRSTSHRPWYEYYTPPAERAIAGRYGEDFRLLGYPTQVDRRDEKPASAATVDPHRLVEAIDETTVVVDTAGYDVVRETLARGRGVGYVPAGERAGATSRTLTPLRLVRKLARHQRVVVVADESSAEMADIANVTVVRAN